MKDNCLHFAIIKMLFPGRRIDVYLNSRPFAVNNYEDVASLLTGYEKKNKEKRRKWLVKHFASISSLCGMCMEREILTMSGHHQTMKTGTKREYTFQRQLYHGLLIISVSRGKLCNRTFYISIQRILIESTL